MAAVHHAFAIRINPEDPAKMTIAEDLAACGGTASASSDLVYRFPTAARRDEALRALRGWAGTRSVEAVDRAVDSERPAAPGATPTGEVAPSSPGQGRVGARTSAKDGDGGAPQADNLSRVLPRLMPKLR